MRRRGLRLCVWVGLLGALLGGSAARASARYGSLLVHAHIGASPKSVHNTEALRATMGSGKLVGGSIGATAGEYWRVGVKGESIAREDPWQGTQFKVGSLSVWADRQLCLLGPFRLGAEFDLGTAFVHVRGSVFADDTTWWDGDNPWPHGRYQFGLLIQPGLSLGWHPVGLVEFSGTLGYRWTTVDRIDDSAGYDLLVDGRPVTADLNGPAGWVGITLFLPTSGPLPPNASSRNSR